jgi:ABC-type multidrug transport system ATPase subunit
MNQRLTEEVQAFGLVKRYGNKLAVNDLSFSLKPGQITGFLGPNGAGKTTTMQLMLSLIHGEGCTLFDGQKYAELKQPGRVVGALLDPRPFHPTRTARRHLRMMAPAVRGSSRACLLGTHPPVGMFCASQPRRIRLPRGNVPVSDALAGG